MVITRVRFLAFFLLLALPKLIDKQGWEQKIGEDTFQDMKYEASEASSLLWKLNRAEVWYKAMLLLICIILRYIVRRRGSLLLLGYVTSLQLLDACFYGLDMVDIGHGGQDIETSGLQQWLLIVFRSGYTQWLCRILLLLLCKYYNPFSVFFTPRRDKVTPTPKPPGLPKAKRKRIIEIYLTPRQSKPASPGGANMKEEEIKEEKEKMKEEIKEKKEEKKEEKKVEKEEKKVEKKKKDNKEEQQKEKQKKKWRRTWFQKLLCLIFPKVHIRRKKYTAAKLRKRRVIADTVSKSQELRKVMVTMEFDLDHVDDLLTVSMGGRSVYIPIEFIESLHQFNIPTMKILDFTFNVPQFLFMVFGELTSSIPARKLCCYHNYDTVPPSPLCCLLNC